MNLRDELNNSKHGLTDATKVELLLTYLEDHAPRLARVDAERFVRLTASDPGKRFSPQGEQLRRAVKGNLVRACNLVAAHRLDLSGLGHEDLEHLKIVVHHLESQVHAARNRWRRGGF